MRHYLLNGKYLGSAPDEAETILHSRGCVPLRLIAHAIICPNCGSLWAISPVTPDFAPVRVQWEGRTRLCPSCGGGHILSHQERVNALHRLPYTPKGLLIHELLTSLEHDNASNHTPTSHP